MFGGTTEYYAFSSLSPLLAEESKKDTLASFVYGATRDDNVSVGTALVLATQAGLPGLAERYYRYGENGYAFGLPGASLDLFLLTRTKIAAALGVDYSIEKLYIPVTKGFKAAVTFLETSSWWRIYNIQQTLPVTYKGYPMYMTSALDFVVTINQQELGLLGLRTARLRLRIDLSHLPSFPIPDVEDENIPRPEYYDYTIDYLDAPNTYYHDKLQQWFWVTYRLKEQVGEPRPEDWPENRTWPRRIERFYLYPSSIFPDEGEAVSAGAQYYPFIHLRLNGQSYAETTNKTSIERLSYLLGMRAETIYTAFLDAVDEAETDLGKVKDFAIGFFAPMSSTGEIAPYILKIVAGLYTYNQYTRADFLAYINGTWDTVEDVEDYAYRQAIPGPYQGFSLQDESIVYTLTWAFIERYTSTISIADAKSKQPYWPLQPGYIGKWFTGTELSDSTTLFVAYYIFDMRSAFKVMTPDGYKIAKGSLAVMPVNRYVLETLSYREQEIVLQESLYSAVFLTDEADIPWYQEAFWSGVLVIVAIVLTVVTLAVGVTTITSLVAAGATSGLIYTIVGMALKAGLGFLVSVGSSIVFGDSYIGILVTTVVMIAVGYPGGIQGLMQNTFANLSSTLFASVEGFLKIVTSVGGLGYKLYSAYAVEGLEEDYAASEKDKAREIDDAVLGVSDSRIDGTVGIRREAFIPHMESPSDFLARSLETNPGQRALEAISNFTDSALQLPRTVQYISTTGIDFSYRS